MNRYRNTFKMYRSRYRLISDNTGRTGVYRTFRPEKRNLAGTKTKRKNRRNAWFEQTPVQQVATTLTSPIRSSSSFFFPSSSGLMSFSTALISSLFLLNNEHYVVSLSLFCISFEISYKPFYTWLALKMLKTYIFFNKRWWTVQPLLLFQFWAPHYVMHHIPFRFFVFLYAMDE